MLCVSSGFLTLGNIWDTFELFENTPLSLDYLSTHHVPRVPANDDCDSIVPIVVYDSTTMQGLRNVITMSPTIKAAKANRAWYLTSEWCCFNKWVSSVQLVCRRPSHVTCHMIISL